MYSVGAIWAIPYHIDIIEKSHSFMEGLRILSDRVENYMYTY